MLTRLLVLPAAAAAVMLASPATAQSDAVTLAQAHGDLVNATALSIEPVTKPMTDERFVFEVACDSHYEPEAIARCLAQQ